MTASLFVTLAIKVYRLVTEDTIEEKVVERAQQKLKLDAMVVQRGMLQGEKKLEKDELLAAIRWGAFRLLLVLFLYQSSQVECFFEVTGINTDLSLWKNLICFDPWSSFGLGFFLQKAFEVGMAHP